MSSSSSVHRNKGGKRSRTPIAMEEFLCSMSAACEIFPGKIQQGELVVFQISNVTAIARFEGEDTEIEFDLHSAVIDFGSTDVRFTALDERILIVKLDNNEDLQILRDAYLLSREVCDLTLRLRSVARDFYFSGVYRAKPEATAVFSELIQNIDLSGKEEQDILSDIVNVVENSSSKDGLKSLQKAIRIKCIFCDEDSVTSPSLDFLSHPYVSCNFHGEELFLCSKCHGNWQSYR